MKQINCPEHGDPVRLRNNDEGVVVFLQDPPAPKGYSPLIYEAVPGTWVVDVMFGGNENNVVYDVTVKWDPDRWQEIVSPND